MEVGVYGVKPLKANTLKPLLKQSRLDHYALGHVLQAFSEFTHHCGRFDGSVQVRVCPFRSYPTPLCSLFFFRTMVCTSKTMRTQIENLWDHLDQVVRAVNPHPLNVAKWVIALELAWLNIPVNTCKNLIGYLPARLAAVRSAKGF
ncbi:uncharacterized protein TNCV_1834761 [Trichonephila clavipes]|nr:uncharacterized protein TNCV_1834761 [Trichonephila clavipes]